MSSRDSAASSRRRQALKKGIDATDGRRRRNETAIKLRKDKKEESMLKRRAMPSSSPPDSTSQLLPVVEQKTYTALDIPALMQTLGTSNVDQNTVLECIRGFRRMLSVELNPPVEEVLACGVMPALVQLLSSPNTDIQFEAAWALTNVASTDHTHSLISHSAIDPLILLLRSDNAEVRDQSIWCLGNIAGDSPELRDVVLQAGVMGGLLQNITQPASESLLGNAVWTLSNLCRGKPPHASLTYVGPAIPILVSVLKADNIKMEVKIDACWALSYLCDGCDERIQAVMDGGACPVLVNLLQREESGIVTPCLRALGNFVSGSDVQTQAVLDEGILDVILKVLTNPKRSVRKEAFWLISNIAAGTQDQIGELFRRRNIPDGFKALMSSVIHAVENDEWEVRREAVWVVSNVATGGTDYVVQLLVTSKAMEALCSVLTLSDAKISLISLEAIETMLKVGEKMNLLQQYQGYLDEAGGIDKLEELQEHANEKVYEKALHIIDTFFGGDELEHENLAPESNGDRYVFGAPPTEEKSLEDVTPEDVLGSHVAQPLTDYNFQF